MRKVFICILVAGCGLPILGFSLLAVFPGEILINLAIGWVLYLGRVPPSLRVNWAGVATAVVCLVALVMGLHRFLQWLALHVGRPTEAVARDQSPWPFRRTIVLLGLVR
jgi:hypothetical protein